MRWPRSARGFPAPPAPEPRRAMPPAPSAGPMSTFGRVIGVYQWNGPVRRMADGTRRRRDRRAVRGLPPGIDLLRAVRVRSRKRVVRVRALVAAGAWGVSTASRGRAARARVGDRGGRPGRASGSLRPGGGDLPAAGAPWARCGRFISRWVTSCPRSGRWVGGAGVQPEHGAEGLQGAGEPRA